MPSFDEITPKFIRTQVDVELTVTAATPTLTWDPTSANAAADIKGSTAHIQLLPGGFGVQDITLQLDGGYTPVRGDILTLYVENISAQDPAITWPGNFLFETLFDQGAPPVIRDAVFEMTYLTNPAGFRVRRRDFLNNDATSSGQLEAASPSKILQGLQTWAGGRAPLFIIGLDYIERGNAGDGLFLVVGQDAGGGKIFRSFDGLSFETTAIETSANNFSGIANNGDIIIVTTFGGASSAARIHRSSDGGSTWGAVQNLPNTTTGVIAGVYENTFIVGGDLGQIWTSSDGLTGNWTVRTTPGITRINALEANVYQSAGTILGVDVGGRIIQSQDSGASWANTATPGSAGDPLNAIAWNPNLQSQVMVVGNTGRVFISNSSGNTMTQRSVVNLFGSPVDFVAVASIGSAFVACVNANEYRGLLITNDFGRTWMRLGVNDNLPFTRIRRVGKGNTTADNVASRLFAHSPGTINLDYSGTHMSGIISDVTTRDITYT